MAESATRTPDRAHGHDALAELAAAPESISARKLWFALDAESRAAAVRVVLKNRETEFIPAGMAEELERRIASTFNFRRQTIQTWPVDRIARDYGAKLRPRNTQLLDDLLRALHLGERRELLAEFLDILDIPNDEGAYLEEEAQKEVAQEAVFAAADRLLESHGWEKCSVYFLTLIIRGDPLGAKLAPWLRDHGAVSSGQNERKHASTDALQEDIEDADSAEAPEGVEKTDQFTTLDRMFVYAITDVAQGIEGALSEDQLEDAVEELISLNRQRHRSFFHAGLMDSELSRDPREELPAQNADRLRWYWAGFVTGLARRELYDQIARLFDAREAVRDLGKGGQGPSHAAGRLVFESLCRCDRPGEAARFLDVETVIRNELLLRSLLREGTRLLRENRAAEARAILDLLGEAVRRLEAMGVEPTPGVHLEIRRRRAHCYRQMGEQARARELLERLLEEEVDPDVCAMAHADLGLIEGGFRRLSDLQLPDQQSQVEGFRRALERGESRFREGADVEARYGGHGRFCLGVLELVRGEFRAAADHLDVALSVFESSPSRYRHNALLANARMYLGLAIALDLQTEQMTRATELIRKGVSGGATVPNYFLGDVLEGLRLRNPELARRVAEAVYECAEGEVLDDLIEAGAGIDSEMLATALLRRADENQRGEHARARDLTSVLPLLLHQDRLDEARIVLDRLEGLALEGVNREDFLEILQEPSRHEPAWDRESAFWSRVQCLESAARYEEAAALLREEFHRVLGSTQFGRMVEAEGILERIRGYGVIDDEYCDPLEARLDALRSETQPDEGEERDQLSVRILFVGGDERQTQHARRIEREFQESEAPISVTFLHPGWGSNWGGDLERACSEIERHDGVVIMRFIRTEFGRQLRKELGSTPWRACTAAGLRTMKASIREAAAAAREHLRRKEDELTGAG